MLESLIQFVQENNRICPKPNLWNKLWQILPNKKRVGAGWEPPLPLILGAWWLSSGSEKQLLLIEHLKYAASNGVLEQVDSFLRGLDEDEWAHIGDF